MLTLKRITFASMLMAALSGDRSSTGEQQRLSSEIISDDHRERGR